MSCLPTSLAARPSDSECVWLLTDVHIVQSNPHNWYAFCDDGASWNFLSHKSLETNRNVKDELYDVFVSSLYRHVKLHVVPQSVICVCLQCDSVTFVTAFCWLCCLFAQNDVWHRHTVGQLSEHFVKGNENKVKIWFHNCSKICKMFSLPINCVCVCMQNTKFPWQQQMNASF